MKDNEIIILVVISSLIVLSLGFNSYGGMMMPYRDYGQYGGYLTYGFGWMGMFMLLIWALIIINLILGIIWLTKQIQK